MHTAENTNDLIASIYDASLDSTLWMMSLQRISDMFGGSTTGIGVSIEGHGTRGYCSLWRNWTTLPSGSWPSHTRYP
jgi:hypothetical protein